MVLVPYTYAVSYTMLNHIASYVLCFQKLEEELAECKSELQRKQGELEHCQGACIEAENEYYEAIDKIEVGGVDY